MSILRTRWAAIEAAVAVSLGAGGLGLVDATTSSGEMPIYVPIEPCRLLDTRPNQGVGGRTTPLAPAEIYTLDGWGAHGQCTLPSGTTALALNVTAISPTLLTHFTLYPGTGTPPNASHLNPAPGQPPTPNAVNVDLDTSGKFSIFNFQGNVHVIIDIVGYYDDHVHNGSDIVDGSLTGADLANNSVSNVVTSNEPGIVFGYQATPPDATPVAQTIVSTSIRVPSDGFVAIEVTGLWVNEGSSWDEVECQLQKGTVGPIDQSQPFFWLNDRITLPAWNSFSAHRVVPIFAADNPVLRHVGQKLSLQCRENSGVVRFLNVHISGTFYPTTYAPAGVVLP